MEDSIENIINSLGVGRFFISIFFAVGVLWISDSSELNIVSIIGPELRCEWNLSSLQTSMTSVSVFFGMGIGSMYWGYLGDKYGRKHIMVVGSLMIVYFGLLSSIAPNYTWYVVLRFFVGIGVGSTMFASSYVAEFIVKKHRGKAVISLNLFYSLGSFYVAGMALLLMQHLGWRILLMVATIPSTLFLCVSFWLPESVHYLQNTGKHDDIVKILDRISRTNNVPINAAPRFECASSSKRGNVGILLRKEYRWKMVITAILFITSLSGYFGVVMLNTEFLQMDTLCQLNTTKTTECHRLNITDYSQNLFVTASEFLVSFLVIIVVDKIGRKTCLFPGFILTGIGFLGLNFCSLRQSAVFMFMLRFIISGLNPIHFLLAAELFPTVVRTSALGILILLVKFTSIGVPFLTQNFVHTSLAATCIIFALPCFLSAVLVLFLPETKNIALRNV